MALQNSEIFLAHFDTSTLPSTLTFRYHRNRVDRKYRYGTVTMAGETFEAQVLPTGEKYAETFEHIWLVKLRGFEFLPELWAEYDTHADSCESMTDLPTLQALYTEAEKAYMEAISKAPPVRSRSPECQYIIDCLCDAMQRTSRDLREAKKQAFYARQDEVRAELREQFLNVRFSDVL